MDKRLIILMAVALLGSSAFFAYRKLYYKPEGIRFVIKPNSDLKVGDSISFEDQTKGATRWKWNFGDGEFSVERSGHHIFLDPGTYQVALTAYGPFGMLHQDTRVTVVARDILSTVSQPGIVGPSTATVGVASNWQCTTTAQKYVWTVEGDAALANQSQTGASATFTFKRPGAYSIVLNTKSPDATVRQDVTVAAAAIATPQPVRSTASIPMPPKQHATHKHPVRQEPKQGNKLEDLGGPVEIKK